MSEKRTKKRVVVEVSDKKKNEDSGSYNNNCKKENGMTGTKEQIVNYLIEKMNTFSFEETDDYTTNMIAKNLNISRTAASQYLNELVDEGKVLKIKSRPVYFFSLYALEKTFKISFRHCDFLDLEDFRDYVSGVETEESEFSSYIGYEGSMKNRIKQAVEIFEYPPEGLPLMIYGSNGTGKMTLAEMICHDSMQHNRSLKKDAKIIRTDIREKDQVSSLAEILEKEYPNGAAVIIAHFERADEECQNYLADWFASEKAGTGIHPILLSEVNPSVYMSTDMYKAIPFNVHLHKFKDRPKEEREAIVIELFRREEKSLHCRIYISSVILRTMTESDYSDNIRGIANAVKMMCARGSYSDTDRTMLTIHTYDMPESDQGLIRISTEDVAYIDVSKYVGIREVDMYMNFFDSVLQCEACEDTSEFVHKFTAVYESFSERILRQTDQNREKLMGLEITLSNIMSETVRKRFITMPGNFNFVIAKLMYIYMQNSNSLKRWEFTHDQQIARLSEKCSRMFVSEMICVEEINSLLKRNLEMDIPDIICDIMAAILYRYNSEMNHRKIFGLIICHGYSTASSIADAVNTLIGSYVFESINMPLDTTVTEIQEVLNEKIQRINRFADVLIMVDMGSLEQIGNGLRGFTNRNIGVINNVTTRMALHIGYGIRDGEEIEKILVSAKENSSVDYRIIKSMARDVILFTSQSGMDTAQRTKDLFMDSLPADIPVDYRICSYEKLAAGDLDADIESKDNILFITGTDNPHLEGTAYIPLEDLIAAEQTDQINTRLSRYLNAEQLKVLSQNIRRNFTLLNVVQYLTILNPQPLLDAAAAAVDQLQKKQNCQLDGKTLFGIYIHVCVMVERLVTKSGVNPDSEETSKFLQENAKFAKDVRDSFAGIRKHYHIEIPDSEMLYLYNFMKG